MKFNSKYIVAIGSVAACFASVALAQIAENGSQTPSAKAAAIANSIVPNAQDALPSVNTAPLSTNAMISIPAVDEGAARAVLAEGSSANANGNLVAAIAAWSKAYSMAPATPEGRKIAREAAKRLGFAAVENRNARMAESYWAAEAILARKLYFAGAINARAFSESLSHWASGAGAMGRSAESSAFVFYAAEVRARAQAAQSSQILNRESSFKADKVESIRVDAGGLCVTDNIEILKAHVSCDDERSMRSDAVSLQTRQITADAPPPPTKAEREAAEAKKKKNGEE